MKSKRPSHHLIKSKATDDDDMIDGSKEAPNDDAISTNEPSSEVLKILEASPDCGDAPASAAAWNAMLYNLLLYKARWGDMNVPNNEEHEALYEWVSEQRSLYKLYQEEGATAGEENEDSAGAGLTSDRISVLDAIGFAWNIRGDVFWRRHYDALVQYKNEHGDVKVPRLFCKNPKLGEWVTEQRRQLKAKMDGRPSMMTEERQQKLDELGFLWKVRERADWNDRYEQLLEYKKEHGHCIVPQHYAQNKALGKWVAKQREQFRFYHAGKHSFLTEERIDLLKSLGFVWRVKGKGKTDLPMDDDPIDMEDSNLSAVLKLPKEEDKEENEASGEPKTKKRKKKVPLKKKAAAAAAAAAVKEDSNANDDDGSDIEDEDEEAVEETPKDEGAKTAAEDSKPAAAVTSVGPVSSMNRMGLLASISDGIPGMSAGGLPSLPSLPADQQLLFAEQQHAVRASILENFAVRANQQMEFAQQRAMANSQTMADIAAALARQSRFGNGFAGGGMGMFNMPGMSLPNMQGDDPEENLRNLNFRI